MSKIGCRYLGLELEKRSELVDAGKCLNDSLKKKVDRFLTLCSVSLESVVQFVTVQV
jgi:hypothetical protein